MGPVLILQTTFGSDTGRKGEKSQHAVTCKLSERDVYRHPMVAACSGQGIALREDVGEMGDTSKKKAAYLVRVQALKLASASSLQRSRGSKASASKSSVLGGQRREEGLTVSDSRSRRQVELEPWW